MLQPLRRLCSMLFRHNLRLRREAQGVRLVFENGPSPVRQKSREELARDRERAELAVMRSELALVLDDLPETRETLRHLVFVEDALSRKGLRALYKVPLPVLQRALVQFEGLVTNWSPTGLAMLRSKMAVAVIDREAHDPDAEADAYRTSAVIDTPPARAAAQQGAAAAARRRAEQHAETAPMVLRVEVDRQDLPVLQSGGELGARHQTSRPRRPSAFETSAPIGLRELSAP